MCIVCTEWLKGSLTANEAKKNLGEMIMSTDDEALVAHYFEIAEKVSEDNAKP